MSRNIPIKAVLTSNISLQIEGTFCCLKCGNEKATIKTSASPFRNPRLTEGLLLNCGECGACSWVNATFKVKS